MSFSIVLLMAPGSAYSQNLQTIGNAQERTRLDTQSRFDIGTSLSQYTHELTYNKLLQASRFKKFKLGFSENSDNFNGNYNQVMHITNTYVDYYDLTSGYDIYSDKKLRMEIEPKGSKLELVKTIHPQLYNLNSKKYIPGPTPSRKKNDYKIAEQLLMIIYPTLEQNSINRVLIKK
jgi:hypothetical protein